MMQQQPRHAVWLGVPLEHCVDSFDAYSSFIGGVSHWLRRPAASDVNGFRCPKCVKADAQRQLLQIYAPLNNKDRVIYVLHCSRCSEKDRAYLYVFRSVSYIPTQSSVKAENAEPEPTDTAQVFAEDDDWGDGEDASEEAAGAAPPRSHVPSPPTPSREDPRGSVTANCDIGPAPDLCVVPSKASGAHQYAALHLDILEEPAVPSTSEDTLDALHAISSRRPASDVVDLTVEEVDDDSAETKREQEFYEAIALVPQQVVRWQPGGVPLRCTTDPVSAGRCAQCGAPQRFECQLMPPLIYYLTRTIGEAKHALRFSTALIYTCSADCYSPDVPYAAEYVSVHHEV